jgi:Dyp-type peroxidase family
VRTAAAQALAGLGARETVLLQGVSLLARGSAAGPDVAPAPARAAIAPADRPAAAGVEPVYDAPAQADIQGLILPGFNSDHQQFVFLRFGPVAGARSWLREIAPKLATLGDVQRFREEFRAARQLLGVRQPDLPATWRAVALSWRGVAALRGPAEANRFGDLSFRQGLAERSTFLGDPTDPARPGHRANWVVGGPDGEADALVIVAADSADDLAAATRDVVDGAERRGLTVLFAQRGGNLPGALAGHEHFGFKDGISQPGVRGTLADPDRPVTPRLLGPADPRQWLFARPGQPLVWPGQFLLGEPRQDPQDPLVPAAASSAFPAWARRGSYLVCRRLAQDVAGFWDDIAGLAAGVGADPVALAARLVGRWPSGAPVLRTPDADDPVLAGDEFASNHFLFDDETRPSVVAGVSGYPGDHFAAARADLFGAVCPHAAHIRKMNPRDSATDFGTPADTLLRLMLRRGIPYGPPLAGVPDPPADLLDAERGLMFVAVMASIEDQFEFVTRRWANSPTLPNVGGPDPIIGQLDRYGDRRRSVILPGGRTVEFARDHVVPTGGGYFFVPPISAVSGALASA